MIDSAREVAELVKKYNDIELNRRIVNLEIEVAGLQRDKLRLEAENEDLKAKLRVKQAMQYRQPYYWQDGDEVPFCKRCWEGFDKAVHLDPPYRTETGEISRWCTVCQRDYYDRR